MRKWKCGQICLIKISRSNKNRNKLCYGYDFGCGFNSWFAPINDVIGYSIDTIIKYGEDKQIVTYTTKMQELKDEIKKKKKKSCLQD